MVTKKLVSGILLILLQCAMISSISIATATSVVFSQFHTPIQSGFRFGDTISFTMKLRVFQNSGPPLSIENMTITALLSVGETFVKGSSTSTPSSSFMAYPNGTLFWNFGRGPFQADPQAMVSYNVTVIAGASGWTYNKGAAAYTEIVTGYRSVPKVTDGIFVVEPGQRKLTIFSAHDSPSPSNGDNYFSNGSSVNCFVTSPVTEGGMIWTCTGWSGTGSVPLSGLSSSVSFIITQDSSITWNWNGQPVQWKLSVISAHDSPSPSVGDHLYSDGSSVTCGVSSPVIEGGNSYTCIGWVGTGSVALSGSGVSTTFTITQNSTITWNWIVTPPVQWKLTVSSAHDSPSPSNGDSFWSDGQPVTCSVTSPVIEGGTIWTCAGWSGNGSVPMGGTGKAVTFAITQDSSITWNWSGSTVQPRASGAVLTVTVEVGSPHFRGETAEFAILTSVFGRIVNATILKSKLYCNGTLTKDLNSAVKFIETGFYRIPYEIPSDAQLGEYSLLVEAAYYGASGASIAKFTMNPTLTAWNDQIKAIQNGIAPISNGMTDLSLNLAAINATLAGLIMNNGQIMAKMNMTIGTLSTKLNTINAKFGGINGNTVTIFSILGNITKLNTIQTTAITTLYAAVLFAAIAIILAAAILVLVKKK